VAQPLKGLGSGFISTLHQLARQKRFLAGVGAKPPSDDRTCDLQQDKESEL